MVSLCDSIKYCFELMFVEKGGYFVQEWGELIVCVVLIVWGDLQIVLGLIDFGFVEFVVKFV